MPAKIGIWKLFLSITVSLVITSCSSSFESSQSTPNSTQTSDKPPLADPTKSASLENPQPSSCDDKFVEQLVPRVLKAINEADRAQLAVFFGDDLEWYSAGKAGDHRFIKAVTPTQLMDYLEQRRRQREKTELLDLAGIAWNSMDVSWNMKFRISADDLATNPMDVYAKAQASCRTRRITRWSVGSE